MTFNTLDPDDCAEAVGEDTLRLDNQLCFGLYAAAHAMTRAYRGMLGEMGLTYPQYLAMLALWEHDGQSVSELGARLRLDSGTLTPMLKRMEAANLLARARSRADEREVEVTLTQHGQALRERARDVRGEIACRLGMTEEEIRRLRRDIDSVIGQLDKSADRDATPSAA